MIVEAPIQQDPSQNIVKNDETTKVSSDHIVSSNATAIESTPNQETPLTLQQLIEKGIVPDKAGLSVFADVDQALSDPLKEIFAQPDMVSQADAEQLKKDPNFKLYQTLKAHVQSLPNSEVSIVKQNGKNYVTTAHDCGPNLQILQVFESKTAVSDEQHEALQARPARRVAGNRFRESRNFGDWQQQQANQPVQSPPAEVEVTPKVTAAVADVLIKDKDTGNVFSVRHLLPDDWTLTYDLFPLGENTSFTQDTDEKIVGFGALSEPWKVFALLHEIGHGFYTANDSPENYRLAKEYHIKAKIAKQTNTPVDPELSAKAQPLLMKNERGAHAFAIQMLRMLKTQGVDTGLSFDDVKKIIDKALSSYEG